VIWAFWLCPCPNGVQTAPSKRYPQSAETQGYPAEYVSYYTIDRCHPDEDAPEAGRATRLPIVSVTVVALPRVGGLHHRYEWSDSGQSLLESTQRVSAWR
jgi:hypothetical protein